MAKSVVIGWFLALALLMLAAGEYLVGGLLAGAMFACNALMRDAKPFIPYPAGSDPSGLGVGVGGLGGTGGIGLGDEAAAADMSGDGDFGGLNLDHGIDLQDDSLYHGQSGNIWRDSFIGDNEL